MIGWNCLQCSEPNEAEFELCWNCGTDRDGGAADPGFARARAADCGTDAPAFDCLRCAVPMRYPGRKAFHEGSQLAPFLLGGVGELLVKREAMHLHACPRCGRVELSVDPQGLAAAEPFHDRG